MARVIAWLLLVFVVLLALRVVSARHRRRGAQGGRTGTFRRGDGALPALWRVSPAQRGEEDR